LSARGVPFHATLSLTTRAQPGIERQKALYEKRKEQPQHCTNSSRARAAPRRPAVKEASFFGFSAGILFSVWRDSGEAQSLNVQCHRLWREEKTPNEKKKYATRRKKPAGKANKQQRGNTEDARRLRAATAGHACRNRENR